MTRAASGLLRGLGNVYVLLVVASALYAAPLFGHLACWGRGDWDQFTFRYGTPRAAMLRDGVLPTWNPYVGGGNVLLAHPHSPALSPWYLPVLLAGAPLGLRLQVLMFVALGAVGTAVLARRLGVSPAGAFLGGVVLMMSAHFALHIAEGHLEWCLLGLVPWIFWCLLRAEDDRRFVVFGALVLASAVLHGSVYVVAVFGPLLGLWAVLESLRKRRWSTAVNYAGTAGLAMLLAAVVLLPRIDFLWGVSRSTEREEQVAWQMLPQMLLDPRQDARFRATRDVRNPPPADLGRTLAVVEPDAPNPYQTLPWQRLELTLETTSDWTELNFQGFPYRLFFDEEGKPNRTDVQLDALPPGDEGIALKNPQRREPLVRRRATLYARLPERGGLNFVIARGDRGITRLTIARGGHVLLEAAHRATTTDRGANRETFTLGRDALRQPPAMAAGGDGPWYPLEAVLQATSDWCTVRAVNSPYLFLVEPPEAEDRHDVRLTATALSLGPPRDPARTEGRSLRAVLLVRPGNEQDVRFDLLQGRVGASSLTLRSLDGESLPTETRQWMAPGKQKVSEYVLPAAAIRDRLGPEATPLRWRLDTLGMIYGWHEYGLYVTWLGLAAAVVGLVTIARRQWPLLVAGGVAGLVALGAALPIDLWGLLKLAPPYASLQAPSRFLMAVVFVLAVAVGFGLDRLSGAVGRRLGRRAGTAAGWSIALAVYAELAVLGWSLFSGVFDCPPRQVHRFPDFAQRYAEDDARYAAMYSGHAAYLRGNSGVLRNYENIMLPAGRVRLVGDADYRGEAYLEGGKGSARITRWTMSRVEVAVEPGAADRLVLNQNYAPGWKAVRHAADGPAETWPAEPNADGLVSVAVGPGDRQVEFVYLPPSFALGAAVSCVALGGCLVYLAAGRLRGVLGQPSMASSKRPPAGVARVSLPVGIDVWRRILWRGAPKSPNPQIPKSLGSRAQTTPWLRRPVSPAAVLRLPLTKHLAWGAALNVPFLLCHPGGPLLTAGLWRSLAVSAVLLVAPGLPVVGLLVRRGGPPRAVLLRAMVASVGVLVAVLAALHLSRSGVTAAAAWNTAWLVTNVGVLLNVVLRRRPGFGIRALSAHAWVGPVLFGVCYVVFFHAATELVPPMEDHDYETQGTARSLVEHGQMRLLTDRGTDYYFAHPPLAHLLVAGSFLYYGQLDDLAVYDRAWQRVAQSGSDREAVRKAEVDGLYDHFRRAPHRLATRTPNVLLAALTVALLGGWVVRMTGRWWLALLVGAVYATSPEVFVRSAYGGYFALTLLAALAALLGVEPVASGRRRTLGLDAFLAGAVAALANHKLVLLPLAVIVWELARLGRGWTLRRGPRAVLNPLAVGFAAGTLVFWAYGLSLQPAAFVQDHLRYHLADRILHNNPLGYTGYPTAAALWLEFWRHTGYILLPLGLVALVALCRRDTGVGALGSDSGDGGLPSRRGIYGMPGLWLVWALLTVAAFSLIDWRQTKHLMPLMLPLCLAPPRWAASGKLTMTVVTVALGTLLIWNLDVLRVLAADFASLPITPAW